MRETRYIAMAAVGYGSGFLAGVLHDPFAYLVCVAATLGTLAAAIVAETGDL